MDTCREEGGGRDSRLLSLIIDSIACVKHNVAKRSVQKSV